jgi:hypothetical protein
MRRSLTMTLAVLVAVTLLLAGCGDDTEKVDADQGGDRSDQVDEDRATPPQEEPTTTGPIASVQPFEPVTEDCTPAEELDPNGSVSSDDPPICTPVDNDVLGTFLIAPGTGVGEVDAASVTVDANTLLLIGDGSGGWEAGHFENLTPGTEVQVWAGGAAMAESYPVQFTAQAVAYQPPAPGHDAGGSTTAPPPTTSGGSGGSQELPADDPTTTGAVLSAEPCPEFDPSTPGTCADGLIGTVVVDAIGDKGTDLSARVTDRTAVLVHDGSGWVPGSFKDIQPDTEVRVWVEGGTLTKSLPAQGDAATIAVGPAEG